MKPVWLVARWEYLTRIRSKFFLISTVLMPLLIVGMTFRRHSASRKYPFR